MPANSDPVILALDVGDHRIGVARATHATRLAQPLKTIEHTADILDQLQTLCQEEHAVALVLGLPRSLDGNDTAQTQSVRQFAKRLEERMSVPLYLQDEALTSHKAEQELRDRGVTYNKGEVDALAAAYILSDFLGEHPEV